MLILNQTVDRELNRGIIFEERHNLIICRSFCMIEVARKRFETEYELYTIGEDREISKSNNEQRRTFLGA